MARPHHGNESVALDVDSHATATVVPTVIEALFVASAGTTVALVKMPAILSMAIHTVRVYTDMAVTVAAVILSTVTILVAGTMAIVVVATDADAETEELDASASVHGSRETQEYCDHNCGKRTHCVTSFLPWSQ